jgi:ACS family sodium-dependent inorganic phosphate cotransporter
MAISNTFATLPGIISPILTGHIIKEQTKSEWNIVFWISALIYLFGAIMYGLLGSGETQPWAFTSATNSPAKNETAYVFKDNEVNPLNIKNEKTGQSNTSYETIEK